MSTHSASYPTSEERYAALAEQRRARRTARGARYDAFLSSWTSSLLSFAGIVSLGCLIFDTIAK